MNLDKVLNEISGADHSTTKLAKEKLDQLLKPIGSLGKLEDIISKIAGITKTLDIKIDKKVIVVIGADNGITDEGVSSFPKHLTKILAEVLVSEKAGVSVLAKSANADVKIVDMGIDTEDKISGVIDKKVKCGTGNIVKEVAFTRDEAIKAIENGIEIVDSLVKEGYNLIGTGEIGIGNTTTSSACLSTISDKSVEELTGRGAGLSDEGFKHKIEIIKKALSFHNVDKNDSIDIVSKLGGLDIAGLMGLYIGAGKNRIPIVIDGFISGIAALLAYRLKPELKDFMIASHSSVEPGAVELNRLLNLNTMLDMDMRLGEGSGAALAFKIIDSASDMFKNMGTFSDIGM